MSLVCLALLKAESLYFKLANVIRDPKSKFLVIAFETRESSLSKVRVIRQLHLLSVMSMLQEETTSCQGKVISSNMRDSKPLYVLSLSVMILGLNFGVKG